MYLQVKDKISAYVMSCLVVVSCSYSNSKKKKKKRSSFRSTQRFFGSCPLASGKTGERLPGTVQGNRHVGYQETPHDGRLEDTIWDTDGS